jgi:hypothetical protein
VGRELGQNLWKEEAKEEVISQEVEVESLPTPVTQLDRVTDF